MGETTSTNLFGLLDIFKIEIPALSLYLVTRGLIVNGFTLLFVAIIIVGVIYSAIAGLKFIRSQGDTEQVEGSSKALVAILMGLGAAFLGAIVVILIGNAFVEGSRLDDALRCITLNDVSKCEDSGTTGGSAGAAGSRT